MRFNTKHQSTKVQERHGIHSAVNREIAVRDSVQMLSVFRAIDLVSVLNGVVSSSACALNTIPWLHCALQNNCRVDATRGRFNLPTYSTGIRLDHRWRRMPRQIVGVGKLIQKCL